MALKGRVMARKGRVMARKGMRKANAPTLEPFTLQLEHRHHNTLNHHANICHANVGANKKNGNGKNTTSRGKTTPIQSLHKSSLLYAPHVLGKHIAESEEGSGGGEGGGEMCKREDISHKCMHAAPGGRTSGARRCRRRGAPLTYADVC